MGFNSEYDFLKYFDSRESIHDVCEHSDFYEWKNETNELIKELVKIAEISIVPHENQYDIKYWGVDAPVILDYYPYYGCEIFECMKCKNLFFYYLELGGHGAQKRYRLIRRELFVQNK